jgi:leader peptidase (prepilin peptidase)/N-methyltransferase
MAGAWFGWRGAVFTLLAGAVQGTLAALVVIAVQGRIEEPDSVKREREEMHRALAQAEGPERERLARELAADPIFTEPSASLGKARLAFGPFLALALLEYMLLGSWIWSEIVAL